MTIESLPFRKEFQEGAYNAINVCLRLKPDELITIITDKGTAEIAAAVVAEIKQVGSEFRVFTLEDFAKRPLTEMPQEILQSLEQSQASIYAASGQEGELKIRMQMMEVINSHRIRHGHMVNISPEIMLQGMRADFLKIDAFSSRLVEKARLAQKLTAKTPAGTDIEVAFSPELKWLKTSGIISPDKWGNLPGGEIFTSPYEIDGIYVVDGVVGNYLCEKYGDLKEMPLRIDIEGGRIKNMSCPNKELLREFRNYVTTDENSDRVGEFAIGTNLAAKEIIGKILQDEKVPGIHIAFGHPYSEHTGADWVSSTHIDCVGRKFDIWFDGEQIMEKGTFLIDVNGM